MDDRELDQLLRRPAVIAAVRDLGVDSLGPEDVLSALRALGSVRIDVTDHAERPFVCVLDSSEGRESRRGRTVMGAALACWADALDALSEYGRRGVTDLERFLLDSDPA